MIFWSRTTHGNPSASLPLNPCAVPGDRDPVGSGTSRKTELKAAANALPPRARVGNTLLIDRIKAAGLT